MITYSYGTCILVQPNINVHGMGLNINSESTLFCECKGNGVILAPCEGGIIFVVHV